jgi:hypothetical protein
MVDAEGITFQLIVFSFNFMFIASTLIVYQLSPPPTPPQRIS